MVSIFRKIIRYCDKLLKAIKKFFQDIPMFGLVIAHYNFWGTLGDLNLIPSYIHRTIKLRTSKIVYNFLNSKYSSFIATYKEKKTNNGKFSKIIRCFWWQGIDNAPDLVKICINSIKKHSCGYKVVILDQYNYKDYVYVPEYILKKVKDKKLIIAHLSDIIRMSLLSQYGGIWIDATMYITRDILHNFDKLNVISDNPKKYTLKYGGYEKWCTFFIGGASNNILFDFAYNFFLQYAKDFDRLINYYLLDYSINLAYKNIPECKKDIDKIPLSNDEMFTLVEIFNNTYDEKKYNQLMKFGYFKLTNKAIFEEYDNKGNLTNYGHFLKENQL